MCATCVYFVVCNFCVYCINFVCVLHTSCVCYVQSGCALYAICVIRINIIKTHRRHRKKSSHILRLEDSISWFYLGPHAGMNRKIQWYTCICYKYAPRTQESMFKSPKCDITAGVTRWGAMAEKRKLWDTRNSGYWGLSSNPDILTSQDLSIGVYLLTLISWHPELWVLGIYPLILLSWHPELLVLGSIL